MSDTYTIILPIPQRPLWPNGRPHWRAKAKLTKAYRETAKLLTMEKIGGGFSPWPAATVHLVFKFPKRGRRDKDNALAAMKAGMDGIADAGLVTDDKNFTYLPVVIGEVDPVWPRVVVTVTKQP